MLNLCKVTKVKVFFLVRMLLYVFNFNLFEFSATILEKGLLLINRVRSKFWSENSEALKTVRDTVKEAITADVIDVRITWVSNYRYPMTKSSNWIPVIGYPSDRAPIS